MKQIVFAVLITCLPFATVPRGEAAEEAKYDLVDIKLLDLETAQRIALKDNPGIGAAQARLEQAKAKVKQAMAAEKPSVDASGSTALSTMFDSDIDQNNETGSLALQASWLLFDGYARKFQQEQAKYGVKSSDSSRRNTWRLLISAVADAFFNAQLAQTHP
ncbi:MAG: hypothetical protein D3924_07865, partial [Candidatus Electrothrix sp. AR4]|nr:hypothetical protein [Candidatus Electrothrix sp. AR4]